MNQSSKILNQELNICPKKNMLFLSQQINLNTNSNGKVPCYDEFMIFISCVKSNTNSVTYNNNCYTKYR